MKELNQALYGVLAADQADTVTTGTLGQLGVTAVEHKQPPEGTGYPVVVFFKMDGRDTYTLGLHRAWRGYVYTVKVIDEGHDDELAQSAIARIDALLTDSGLAVAGHGTMLVQRMSDVEYVEQAGGITYQHVGAMFAVMLS